jgi:N-acylneuraminate cytidylyltransferase
VVGTVMKDDVVSLVPVREGSQRVRNKNFRPFAGAPTLLHYKLEQLKAAGCFNHIYVSSDSERAREIAAECRVEFLPRDPFMCTPTPRWDEVIVSIMETIPGDPHVAWTLVTSPLFDRYQEAMEQYQDHLDTHDSLVGVKRLQEYLVDEQGRPFFFSFGPWHPYTTELRPMLIINDAIYIARKSDQIRWRYWFGMRPYLYEMPSLESISINFQEDFEFAEAAEHYRARRSACREVVEPRDPHA